MADEGLVQFLVLAKGAKGAACAALIQQVLNNKKIFVFGELLAMSNVQAVSECHVVVVRSDPVCSRRGRADSSTTELGHS